MRISRQLARQLKNKARLGNVFVSLPFYLSLFAFPGGCGTNAGNPFVELDDGDSTNVSGRRPDQDNPAPGGKIDLPEGSGGEIIVAKNDNPPKIDTNQNQPTSGTLPDAKTMQPEIVVVTATEPPPQGTPEPRVSVLGGFEGGGPEATPSSSIYGIDKSRNEIVSEVRLFAKNCGLVSAVSQAAAMQSVESNLVVAGSTGSGSSSSGVNGVILTQPPSSVPGTLGAVGPIVLVALNQNFKANSIPVLVTAEGTALDNGSYLPSAKNYSVGVYNANSLLCVYHGKIDVLLPYSSQINVKLKPPAPAATPAP